MGASPRLDSLTLCSLPAMWLTLAHTRRDRQAPSASDIEWGRRCDLTAPICFTPTPRFPPHASAQTRARKELDSLTNPSPHGLRG